ncbi:hypothetical protein SEA_LILPHARAOH_62 [Mycobacterium phage LilPharaoh]|uniref:Uncharacterized protein n=1 Tax=Mycobacterium phage Amelie TaxID=1913035 RepID=A0A1J0GQ51_9CAUD|nr:hypothetical protein I5G92_gp61 [Mycobacterium phage Amelie]APC43658.1 hypothetical protein SEA_AMELIE_61 [Mycobacterium phage Amelie]ATN90515.1 hypothetical protein SEA_LILPHARAOH_62 [Mycobacterium phage LilPharaoh]AVP42639.1 hypothetical protein SEA_SGTBEANSPROUT_62 [Mycobacterium phage SgtBeansprout]AXC37167.1 hypothetical protein SEA_BIGLEBOPS_61 [Mycobacterium phage Biglebops]
MYTEAWLSPSGVPVTAEIRNRVDEAELAALYAAEVEPDSARFNALFEAASSATRYCWQYGYRNPRVPGRVAECAALA